MTQLTLFFHTRKIKHPNIISIIGIVNLMDTEGDVWLITEFMEIGSLCPYCTRVKSGELDPEDKLNIQISCWSALDYLHEDAKITHKDIKPENILVNFCFLSPLITNFLDFLLI